jgi:hypothetical protein
MAATSSYLVRDDLRHVRAGIVGGGEHSPEVNGRSAPVVIEIK